MKKTLVSLMVTAILLTATCTVFAAKEGPDGDSLLTHKMAVKLDQPVDPGPKAYEIATWLRDAESSNKIVNKVTIRQGQPSQKAYEIATWLRDTETSHHMH